MDQRERIILGVDPGTTIMGYGLIRVVQRKPSLLNFGVLHLQKYENQAQKLQTIYKRLLAIIEEYTPDEMAVEAPFYGKNVQSMLKLGRAQGVCMAAALHCDMPIFEYAPKRIKQSITGNGNASKEQVAAMLQQMFRIQEMPKHMDASDGLATAVCHFFQNKPGEEGKNFASWKGFLSANPRRKI